MISMPKKLGYEVKVISIKIPEWQYKKINEYIRDKIFSSMSEFIRYAILRMIFEIENMKNKDVH